MKYEMWNEMSSVYYVQFNLVINCWFITLIDSWQQVYYPVMELQACFMLKAIISSLLFSEQKKMTKYASQLKSVVDILKIYINLTRNFNAVCCFPLPLQTFGKNSNQIRATSSAKVCIQTFGINMDQSGISDSHVK